jgi:hypothetical protein
MTRYLVPLLLAFIATLWWRVAQRWERGGRREYIARLDLLPW